MGWGTLFKAEIYISREKYSSIDEVNSEIEDINKSIIDYVTKLKMYAIGNIPDILPEEGKDDPIFYTNNEISQIVEMLNEDIIRMYKLNLLIEFFDTKSVDE